MDTSINLSDNYLDKLLSLSDEMKLRILNNGSRRHVHVGKVKTEKNDFVLPKDIQELIGIASGIEDAEDERLNYLLNK